MFSSKQLAQYLQPGKLRIQRMDSLVSLRSGAGSPDQVCDLENIEKLVKNKQQIGNAKLENFKQKLEKENTPSRGQGAGIEVMAPSLTFNVRVCQQKV